MKNFQITKKGYDKKEVDQYLTRMTEKHQDVCTDQLQRIEELKEEVADLEFQLSEYKSKEDEILNALVKAVETAKQMDNTARIRFALEGERIKIFQSKWEKYVDKTLVNAKIRDEMNNYLNHVHVELAKVCKEELNITRTDDLPKVKKFKEPQKQPNIVEKMQKERIMFDGDDLSDELDLSAPEQQYRSECERLKRTASARLEENTITAECIPPSLADVCRSLGLYFEED